MLCCFNPSYKYNQSLFIHFSIHKWTFWFFQFISITIPPIAPQSGWTTFLSHKLYMQTPISLFLHPDLVLLRQSDFCQFFYILLFKFRIHSIQSSFMSFSTFLRFFQRCCLYIQMNSKNSSDHIVDHMSETSCTIILSIWKVEILLLVFRNSTDYCAVNNSPKGNRLFNKQSRKTSSEENSFKYFMVFSFANTGLSFHSFNKYYLMSTGS